MIEYPFIKFVILEGKAHVGELIHSEKDAYQHVDLVADQLLPLEQPVRRQLARTMIVGWIAGDGRQRQLVLAPDQTDESIPVALDALSSWADNYDVLLMPADLEIREPTSYQPPDVGDSIKRLLGLHALSAAEASEMIGVSPQALSEIQRGRRDPSLLSLRRIAGFFEIRADRLLEASFEQLLEDELASRERFRMVERRIAETRSGDPVDPTDVVGDYARLQGDRAALVLTDSKRRRSDPSAQTSFSSRLEGRNTSAVSW